jgi:hypothetical protein
MGGSHNRPKSEEEFIGKPEGERPLARPKYR